MAITSLKLYSGLLLNENDIFGKERTAYFAHRIKSSQSQFGN